MSLNHSPAIVTDGLVLCLDAANIRSYPRTGTTWIDIVGENQAAMANMNAVSNYSTDNGGYFILDGTNEYFNLGSVLTGSSDFTLNGWFNTDSTTFSYIYGKGVNSNSSGGIGISQTGGGVYGAIGTSTTRKTLTAVGSINTGEWQNLSIAFDRDADATIYLNGAVVGTESISTAQGDILTENDYIGRYGYTLAGFFDGKISMVSAYNRALSADEVRRNYEATVGRYT